MPPSDKLVTTLLAIWKAGAGYLPLDVTFPPNRVQHILGEAKPILVIYDEYENTGIFGEIPKMSYQELLNESKSANGANLKASEMLGEEKNELGFVLYTSGSTGVPKGKK